jgi:cytochrome c oxidase cbb3-type subunit 3
MSTKKLLSTLTLVLVSAPIFAESAMDFEWVSNKSILYALYALIVVLILMVILLGKTLGHLTEHFSKDVAPENRRTIWEQIFQVKSVSTDKDMMLDHEYDGIRELGNPAPPWFMFLFYGTILFAVVYIYRYQISGSGPTQLEEYETEMAEAEQIKAAATATAAATAGPDITAETVTFTDDAEAVKGGKLVFNTNCKVCHADKGMGMAGVGPNLTDEFWIHGGSAKDVFTTIENGVSGKMTPWKGILTGKQISDVMAYVYAQDVITEDQGGKAPEGQKYTPEAEPEATEASPADTTAGAASAE